MLYIDHREKAVLDIISLSDNIQSKVLDVGDFQFFCNDTNRPILIIERKTYADFYQSCRDGRFREQKQRMLGSGFPFIWYVFEGRSKHDHRGQFPDNYWDQIVFRMAMKDSIRVHCTSSTQETVAWIHMILPKLSAQIHEFLEKSNESIMTPCISVKKKENLTPLVLYKLQLEQIPGVSQKTAQCLIEAYPTWIDLLTVLQNDPESVAKLVVSTKVLGLKFVESLLRNLQVK
jgi:ERCC4-type nuclease